MKYNNYKNKIIMEYNNYKNKIMKYNKIYSEVV